MCVLAASPAEGGATESAACGIQAYSYAGLQASRTAHGVAATLVSTAAPLVSDGHVGGWIGVGGTSAGPGGAAEWLQTGLAAFAGSQMEMYYEVTVPGARPRYVELRSAVAAGAANHFAIVEMAHRKSWWRVWVDGHPVSPPIHLPDSDGTWYPQAVAENWNGGAGCVQRLRLPVHERQPGRVRGRRLAAAPGRLRVPRPRLPGRADLERPAHLRGDEPQLLEA